MGREFLPFIFLMLFPMALVWANPPTLNTISELRTIEFGHRFPRHGLHQLYFIARELIVDDDSIIIPTFVPDRGDWGFVSYSNSEGLFPPLQDYNRQGYYSVGSLNTSAESSLPTYVTQSYRYAPKHPEVNRDRVVVRTSSNSQLLEALYITQHYPRRDQYDPQNTWRISPSLLREMHTLSANRVNGLSVFLFNSNYDVSSSYFNNLCYYSDLSRDNNIDQVDDAYIDQEEETSGQRPQVEEASGQRPPTEYTAVNKRVNLSNSDNHIECYEILLEVKATDQGYARIRWSNIPDRLLDKGVEVNICKDNEKCFTSSIITRSYGTYDTSEYLNKGLSSRLQFIETKSEIMRGPTYDDTDRKPPVDINGFNASLQLYTKDRLACALLFIKPNSDWMQKFSKSWVGLYSDHKSGHTNYKEYSWARSFQCIQNNPHYDMCTHCFGTAIKPGAQVRFFLTGDYVSSTVSMPWER